MTSRSVFALVFVVGLSGGACGGDVKKRDAGTDGGRLDGAAADGPRVADGPRAEAGAPGMCVGTFDRLTRTQLGQLSNPAGQCANMADLNVICGRDIGAVTGEEGSKCFASGLTAEGPLVMCVRDGVKMRLDPDLTDTCLECYIQTVACTLKNCVSQCAFAPRSEACVTCQTVNGCLPTFFSCSGLPTGAPPDGGAPDGARPEAGAGEAGTVDGARADGAAVDGAGADGAAADGAADAAPADAAAADGAAADAPADAAADGASTD